MRTSWCKARGHSTHQPEEGGCAEGPVWQEMQPSGQDLGQAVAICPRRDTPAWPSFYPPISCQCLPWAKPEWKVEIKGACCCASRRAGWKRVKSESRRSTGKMKHTYYLKLKCLDEISREVYVDKEPGGLKSKPWTFQHEEELRIVVSRDMGGNSSAMSGKSVTRGGENNFIESCGSIS